MLVKCNKAFESRVKMGHYLQNYEENGKEFPY